MKVKELKIGDYVSYKDKPAKIHSLDSPCIYVDVGDEIWSALEDDGDISPIPLTEEILKRNGWYSNELTNPNFVQIYASFSIEENEWYTMSRQDASGDTFLVNIKYVHELQHILWALKIDDSLNI